MFLEEFQKWNRCTADEQAAFNRFIEEWLVSKDNLNSVICQLAWQIYQLQSCVDGLIEDIEVLSEDLENVFI